MSININVGRLDYIHVIMHTVNIYANIEICTKADHVFLNLS
jgi:hypothetical protein